MRYIWFNKGMLKLPRLDLDALRRNVRSDGLIGEKLLKCFWNTLGLGDEVFQVSVLYLLSKYLLSKCSLTLSPLKPVFMC